MNWEAERIDTPTFQLTPVEKPDMSPFLVHMTGRNELLSIIKGKRVDIKDDGEVYVTYMPEGYGYIKSSIPEAAKSDYKARVVCFTDTPTFGLDFFRRRTPKRWELDQRYGIGFDKEALVRQGVRPVIYLDNNLMKQIKYIIGERRQNSTLTNNSKLNEKLDGLIRTIYYLMFPLLEDKYMQGFMWEREWRYPNPLGFTFDHKDIKVICCPPDEEDALKAVLSSVSTSAKFIHSWREYKDVTEYLERQQVVWQDKQKQVDEQENLKSAILKRRDLLRLYATSINDLTNYGDLIGQLQQELNTVEQIKTELKLRIDSLNKDIDDLEAKIKLKKNANGR